ncbi:hypothetical protein [Caballeronia sp. AZ10_KS36]|uniref:hypothetical protein n=1 Tax=Caballeronia sp. AZ10_KS36 TaxID=2921757 RepID=UPI002027FE6C|nr:hypothetical protein [Caballeronia sp. AZ10_KS36]
MSDISISIVPRQSTYPEPEKKAKEILAWLVGRDIVVAEASDCVLGADFGYRFSNGAKSVVKADGDFSLTLVTNGLEIITERTVFCGYENGLEDIVCPNCKEDIAQEDWDMFNDWAQGDTDNLTCPRCKHASEIHNYKMSWPWGFSNLGFTFYNCPNLTDEFIEEFRKRLGCDVDVVHAHI